MILRTTLATLRFAGRPMCLPELSEVLAVDESTMEGMLDTLVARGRLRTIEPADDSACGGCPIRSGCFIMRDGVARTYALVQGTEVACASRPGGAPSDRAAPLAERRAPGPV